MFRRDLLPSFWSLAVVPVLVYVASWWAWFASETAWARHLTGNVVTSFLQWQQQMLNFHANLVTPAVVANRHPWESKPWSWPMGTRPVLYYVQGGADATGCAGATDCVKRIFLIGTPAMWWLALPVLFWALWRIVGRQDWRYAAVVAAYAAGLPAVVLQPRPPDVLLLHDPGRTVPGAGHRAGARRRARADAPPASSGSCSRWPWCACTSASCVADFAFLWPILNGDPITNAELTARIWLPTWG